MKKYIVYIADRITKFPLANVEVNAISEFHAKVIVRKNFSLDMSYILTAHRKDV